MAKKNDSINIAIFTALKVTEKSGVPTLLMGNPGLGKTVSVELFAKVRGYELVMLRGNSTTPEEIMGYDTVPSDISKYKTEAAVHLRPSWFQMVLDNALIGKKSLLFLDELTTANEFVQAALLHLVFERKVGEEYLPEDTLIVSAGNYSSNLSNSMQMLPPMMNRFMIFNIVPQVSDLDSFLCKFEGAISTGKRNDYFDYLQKKMEEIDAQEIEMPEEQYNKVGEYIERGIRDTVRFLMTSGEKAVDLKVTDMQSIYSDTDTDSKLYGFVSFRTLNYLRDVTIASFLCFGKAGIVSDNYRNMIDGLCGIGLSRDLKTKDTKVTRIGKEFYDAIVNIVNDIEKMKNDRLPIYEAFFNASIKDKSTFGVPEMQAIINKIAEMKADKDLGQIERPIDPDVISKLCEITKASGDNICNVKMGSTDRMLDKLPADKFIGYVTIWNTVADLVTSISSVVCDTKMGYKDISVQAVKDTTADLKNMGFKLRSIRKIILTEDSALGKIIPDIKSISSK